MFRTSILALAAALIGTVFGTLVVLNYYDKPQVVTQVVSQPAASPSVNTVGNFSAVLNSVFPSVVNIATTKVVKGGNAADPFFEFFNDFFSPMQDYGLKKRYTKQSLGSGLVISDKGYILTNYHVVSNAEKIKVTLYDRRVFKGVLIGADSKTDLAIIRIEANNLPTMAWADSDRMQVGEVVLAIGNPFGLSHTVTMGIISAVGRADVGIADYEDFVQTDAAINPGNSGGPLVDTSGRIVGINTAIFSKSGGYQGIGFAVPGNMARLVMEQLIRHGRVVRGWLGISLQDLSPELAKKFDHDTADGSLISETLTASPASIGGLRNGDIVLMYDGHKVTDSSALKNMVARSRPGAHVLLKVLRGGKSEQIEVVVGQLPTEAESIVPEKQDNTVVDAFSGLSVIAMTDDIASQLNLPKSGGGVVVAGISEGSPASEAGLKRGDVIQQIDRETVRTLDDFRRLANESRNDDAVLMYITRNGRKLYIILQTS